MSSPVSTTGSLIVDIEVAAAQLDERETLGYEFHRYRNYYIKLGIQCHRTREISISESGHRLVVLAVKRVLTTHSHNTIGGDKKTR